VDLQEVTSEPACAGHADRPGIRVAEYCLVISQWRLLLWPRGDLSACPHTQVDNAPGPYCGLREKTLVLFFQLSGNCEALRSALRDRGPNRPGSQGGEEACGW